MRASGLMWRPFERKPQHKMAYVAERGLTSQSRLRESLAGVRWDHAPLPPRGHQCWPQTRVVSRQHVTYRCACGGYSPDGRRWLNKNSRRRGRILRWLLGR